MQFAVLADIHGNALALEAVIEDALRRGVTEFVDLGDVLYGPLEPRRVYDLLANVNLIAGVSGNQDRLVAAATDPTSNPTLDFVRNDLGPQPIDWLRSLPSTAIVLNQVLLCHGSPLSDTCYLLEDVAGGRPLVRAEAAIRSDLAGYEGFELILCGHTHVPRLVQLRNKGPLILNPGSVGLPAYDDSAPVPHYMETHSPHACYAIVEKRTGAGWHVSFHRVPYDWDAAAAQARRLGREDWARGIESGRMD